MSPIHLYLSAMASSPFTPSARIAVCYNTIKKKGCLWVCFNEVRISLNRVSLELVKYMHKQSPIY